MRKLTATPYVDPASTDYPKGKTRDKVGGTPGTTGGEILLGDQIQFFQKLVIDAGITENTLPDNVSNGYQLLDALNAKIKERTQISSALTTIFAAAAFNSGTIAIPAVAYDRVIYPTAGGTIGSVYGVNVLIGAVKIGQIVDYTTVTFILPAGVAASLVHASGTCTSFTVYSHKIGL